LEELEELYGAFLQAVLAALFWRGRSRLRWPSVLSGLRLSARDRRAHGPHRLDRIWPAVRHAALDVHQQVVALDKARGMSRGAFTLTGNWGCS